MSYSVNTTIYYEDKSSTVRTLELRSNVRVRGILSVAVSVAEVEDLSSQVITATLCIPRTPTLVPHL